MQILSTLKKLSKDSHSGTNILKSIKRDSGSLCTKMTLQLGSYGLNLLNICYLCSDDCVKGIKCAVSFIDPTFPDKQ